MATWLSASPCSPPVHRIIFGYQIESMQGPPPVCRCIAQGMWQGDMEVALEHVDREGVLVPGHKVRHDHFILPAASEQRFS
eukprot:scaffold292642_cov23-Tisochrysis_lutea.AAC.3